MSRAMVSVIVLTHNRRRLLEKCLRTLLDQDWAAEDYEIIVADDGSADNTREAVERLLPGHPNLRYTHQAHRGVAAARNLGLAAARGDIVVFVADDYELARDYVRTIIRLLSENPGVQVVRFKVVGADDGLACRLGDLYYGLGTLQRLVPGAATGEGAGRGVLARLGAIRRFTENATSQHRLEPAGGAAFRRGVFDAIGTFDERLERSEDADMGARLTRSGIPVYYYPFHTVRHHFERFPGEALAKSYRTGINRYRYHRKQRPIRGLERGLFSRGMEKFVGLIGIVLYCQRTRQLCRLLLYSPCLLLLEAANKLGHLTAMLRESGLPRRRRVSAGP